MSEAAGKPAPVAEAILKKAVVRRFDFREIILVPVLAVIIALVLGAVTMLATGVGIATIGQSFVALFVGSFGSVYALSETVTAAAPLTICGLGLALGFRAGLFNIGAEGQLMLGGIAAVATGFMVGFVEWACIRAIAPHLDDDEVSLGVHVDLSHDAATPPGMEVVARVRLEAVEGRALTFSVEADDARERICAGTHRRFVVDRDRFDAGVARKGG